jgi:large subunit ribosomal protein L23
MPELHPYDVIRRPIVSEKTNLLVSDLKQFTFEVAGNANKFQIAEAIGLLFNIEAQNVLKVRTMVMPAKLGRRGRKSYIRNRQWKKAIVTLGGGATIDLFNV